MMEGPPRGLDGKPKAAHVAQVRSAWRLPTSRDGPGAPLFGALALLRRARENEACYAKPMTWTRKLAKRIALKDGRAIANLAD